MKLTGMDEGTTTLKNNIEEWQFCQYPKYILLPIDDNNFHICSNIKNTVFSEIAPIPLERNLKLVCWSEECLRNILDMDPEIVHTKDFVQFLAANRIPFGALPVAHRYGGHQYGLWAGQLGDGRAHILGEYLNRFDERWQLQLKGSGQTPYARVYDGRAVLRSCIREMIGSEACHYLGIPTTRAAAVVVSDHLVSRDVHCSGDTKNEKAAILLRVAPCWFRFGSFEILSKSGELLLLKQLSDFLIKEYFPEISLDDENCYIRLFTEIAHRTLDMVVKWQGVGFAHGLLNTDNMSILGLTLDYGPFGFVDSYDGGFVANSSDREGRYALSKQPDVVIWNLTQLANAFKPLLNSSQQLHMSHVLKTLETYLKTKILQIFLLKIGVKTEKWGDEQLMEKLLEMMQQTGADMTATFRQLAEIDPTELLDDAILSTKWSLKRLSGHVFWASWVDSYRDRLLKEAVDSNSEGLFETERRKCMLSVNPVYVPRNWMMHEAILDAEKGDFEKVRVLLEVLKKPYEIQPEAEMLGYSDQPPLWSYTLKVSCST